MDWQLPIKYCGKPFTLRAEIIYESSQVMRIRVHGNDSHILLENNYPLIKNGNKAMKWKIRECDFLNSSKPEDDKLIAEIMTELEYQIKGKGKSPFSQVDYLKTKKGY